MHQKQIDIIVSEILAIGPYTLEYVGDYAQIWEIATRDEATAIRKILSKHGFVAYFKSRKRLGERIFTVEGIDPKGHSLVPVYKGGQARSGHDSSGTVYHLAPEHSCMGRALCGTGPGHRSLGWVESPGADATCPKCRAIKTAAQTRHPYMRATAVDGVVYLYIGGREHWFDVTTAEAAEAAEVADMEQPMEAIQHGFADELQRQLQGAIDGGASKETVLSIWEALEPLSVEEAMERARAWDAKIYAMTMKEYDPR